MEAREKEISDAQRVINKAVGDLDATNTELTKLGREKENIQDELTKMKAHMDPTSLTLSDVMKKLREEDNVRFREVLADLDYEGKDPQWYKPVFLDFLDTSGDQPLDKNNIRSLE